MPTSKPTIDDVAKRAGVAAKTVSRVLNSERYVRQELKERINEAIAELGYVPSRAARQLAGHRSFLIAMFFGNVNSNYMTDFMMSAAAACREVGYHLVCEPIDPLDETNAVLDRTIASIRPDGIILLPLFSDRQDVLARIEAAQIPCARIAAVGPGPGTRVAIEEDQVSRTLIEHLIRKGHRRIGMVLPRPDQLLAQGRVRGYRAALEGAGIAYDPALVFPGTFLFDSGLRAGEALLGLPNPPTAIFAANDEMALGVIAAAHRRGLSVPAQLAVAGFDDSNAGRMASPSLTSVRQPLAAMAEYAVASLIGREANGNMLRHTLLLRASTGD